MWGLKGVTEGGGWDRWLFDLLKALKALKRGLCVLSNRRAPVQGGSKGYLVLFINRKNQNKIEGLKWHL